MRKVLIRKVVLLVMFATIAIFLFNLRYISSIFSQEDVGVGAAVSVQCLRNGAPFPCGQSTPVNLSNPSNTSSDKISASFSSHFFVSAVKLITPTNETTTTTTTSSTSDSSSSSSSSSGGGGGGGSFTNPLTATTTTSTTQPSATTTTSPTTSTTTTTTQAEANQPTGFFALSNISISTIVIAVVVISVLGFLILRHI